MLTAVTDRYFADGGRALDFTNKAFESLDHQLGADPAECCEPDGSYVAAREKMRMPGAEPDRIDLVPLCEAAFAELPESLADGRAKRGSWRGGRMAPFFWQ